MTKIKIWESFCDGQNFFYGIGCKKNYKKAFEFLMIAANNGIPHAQNLIGFCYSEGKGIKKDSKSGFKWYRKAVLNKKKHDSSRKNRAIAFCNLAMMCDEGKGVEKNSKLAFKYYKSAAELGDTESQCNLGVLYHEGRGIQQNDKLSIYWTRKAAKKGDDMAQYNLGLFYLDGDGVQKSNKFANLWLKKASGNRNKKTEKKLKLINKCN